jgi:hypothetical protein
MAGFLDSTDGVFVNVGGQTGEMVRDPITNELKIVVGSSQPVGGGPGGPTLTGPGGAPSYLSALQIPVWVWPLAIVVIIVLVAAAFSRK